jgi:hypothetical protein
MIIRTVHVVPSLIKKKWRRLHNEELRDLYSSTNIIRILFGRSRRRMWATGELLRVRVRRLDGKTPLGR